MSKNIEFITEDEETHDKIPIPKPSKSYIPEWYKKSESYINGKVDITTQDVVMKDLKLCTPFLDTMISGYTVELWCDLIVQIGSDGTKHLNWTDTPQPIFPRHKDIAKTMPRPAGHEKDMFAWKMPYGPKTPIGYSCLITHPFNRFDLPFTTTSGIIDSDNYSMPGEIPFFFKNNFEGIIPAGTPIVQIIPFKRDNWKSEKPPIDKKFVRKQVHSVKRTLSGGYKKIHWSKKKYE